MAQQQNPPRSAQAAKNNSKKRKEYPSNPKSEPNKRAKVDPRFKQRDARSLATQTSSTAFKNGELDVDKFVKAREYEIRALEDGMSRSKKALTQRAFQQVPKELRRRTASHNAKRVPKRLQKRAKREMVEDNTPTVTSRRRKPTRHMCLRLETAKKLRALGSKRKAAKVDDIAAKGTTWNKDATAVKSRAPKVKKTSLASPPVVKAKFRKRQLNKTWLPTHMFHAKRARMTPPKDPHWKFAIPLTPTAKSHRPTHRAANERGAIAWDVSYIATIGLSGQQKGMESVLSAVGVHSASGSIAQHAKWMNGTRIWQGLLFQRESPHLPIAPATVIWCVDAERPQNDGREKQPRRAFVRVHPAAFIQVWEELVRSSKVVKPQVTVEDLRFEIGSIDITGPGATKALQGALWPSGPSEGATSSIDAAVSTWQTLKGLASQLMLPPDVLMAFEMQDPRLHHPPRKVINAGDAPNDERLMHLLVHWPLDTQQAEPKLFDRLARHSASSNLPSQKAVNRRRSLATPGEYPEPTPQDPRIPVLLFNTTSRDKHHATWTVLLPWKCIQPLWYSIMYYPLSTGGQPRFGGLDEQRQLAFEIGQPWFPGDYPGTKAGWLWETEQRTQRENEWKRRPKSKRVNWEAVQAGQGEKGEIGLGWACDWERLLAGAINDVDVDADAKAEDSGKDPTPVPLLHAVAEAAEAYFRKGVDMKPLPKNAASTIRIKLLNRGVPQTCARIYRLPSNTTTKPQRQRWLDLHSRTKTGQRQNRVKHGLPRLPKDAPAHVLRQRLAASLLEPPRLGDDRYPKCPGEEDLIGFVTTGNFNLGEGQGTGIGSILLDRVRDSVIADAVEGRLCIVRNAGESVGRLASWEII